MSLDGERQLDYNDKSDHGIDQLESIRDFLDTVQEFIFKKADKLSKTLSHLAIPQPSTKAKLKPAQDCKSLSRGLNNWKETQRLTFW